MEKRQLEEYLSGGYKDYKSFRQNVILPVFGVERFRDGYGADILKNQPELQQLADTTGICRVLSVGEIKLNEIDSLQIFDITVSDRVKIVRNRSSLQRLIRRAMDVHTSAFMIFHYEDAHWDWRFTYCHKGGGGDEFTNSKRYTFLLGPGEWKSCHTAAEHFMTIYEKQGNIGIKDIEEAFSVEALSKEFFGKYKEQYDRFVGHLSNPANGMRDSFIDTGFDKSGLSPEKIRDREEKPIRDYVKKLLGRIVFLHFLQKKGWLGVPADKEWGDGDPEFMLNLYKNATTEQQENFLDEILEPLFNDAFDTKRKNDLYDTKVKGFRNVGIPYLNGGLFERDDLDVNTSWFPSELFEELFNTFSQYNFTIDENDPNDAEVGVDPEMLGRIFENLLEDNKDKGAFYTPKEIVKYMCRESLIAYLQTDFSDDDDKEKIRKFVFSHDIDDIGNLADEIDGKLREVKICDPAIGSGAFPMGLLKELFYCRCAIEPDAIENAAKIKREIIQNNIYGVDIEKGAVDIARLRFWLSLIVDEESPDTLPNLDFKIMQGNSLLEQYQGFDLSKLAADPTAESHFDKEGLGLLYDPLLDDPRRELRKKLEKYYSCDDHDEKRDLREEIKENVYEQLELSREEIKDIEATTEFFLWHTWFYDVFSRPSKEGFDIVIGNPPYIQLKWLKEKKIYQTLKFETYDSSGDIYCLFYELATKIMASHNTCIGTFITSNKWLRAKYGKKLRNFLLKKANPRMLIDLGPNVFEAGVDTNILLWDNASYSKTTLYATAYDADMRQLTFSFPSFKTDSIWTVDSNADAKIRNKVDLINTRLNDYNVDLHYGILTGANKTFLLDKERAEMLMSIDENNRKLIKPILRGQDIYRYEAIFDHWYLLNLHNGIKSRKIPPVSVEGFPTILKYLESFGEDFRNRGEQGDNWWNLRNCKYIFDYEKPKILYSDIVQKRGKFYYDESGYYTNDTAFMIIGENLKCLMAILNSTAFSYIYRKFYSGGGLGKTGLRYKKEFLLKTPIPKVKGEVQGLLKEKVEKIILLKKETPHADTSILEEEIDQIVYKLYGLDNDDIKAILADSEQ